MKNRYIDGQLLKNMMIIGAYALELNKSTVDSLNVFPVPDGDTGTNMSLTMNSATKEVNKVTVETVDSITEAMANGSLMGARGNSGVILSQLYRGFAKSCKGKEKLSTTDFALALKSASDTAYKAVMKPTEGTILTIAREMGEKALEECKETDDFDIFLKNIISHGEKILDKTPQMLKVLKDAGVVDAGGKGLIHIMNGYYEALTGKEIFKNTTTISHKKDEPILDFEEKDIQFGYCTEFLVKGLSIDIESFKRKLMNLGDSMLVVGDETLVKVHIHTNNPGQVLEHGLNRGELIDIKIENMREQHKNLFDEALNEELKEYGIVSVSMGTGLHSIFKDLNVDEIITGGQTMNPSTEEIKKAIDSITANHIFILPNNSNIILAANQAKELSDKNIHVIPTKTIPQGIASILSFNSDLNFEQNIKLMNEAISKVKTGQVTFSVRDTQFNNNDIKKGDILGILNGNIESVGKETEEVAFELLDGMITDMDEMVTIFYGEESSENNANLLAERIKKIHKNIDIEVYYGGQPLYYYIFSVE